MATSRTRLAAWHLATGLLFTALTMATGLLATPWLIRWLGKERFGVARMMVEIFGYLSLLELGLGGGLGPVLARALARRDEKELRGTLSAGLRVYFLAAGITLAAGLALVVGIRWIIPVAPGLVGDLRLGGIVALAGFATLILSPFRALTEAEQRGYRINLLLAAQSLVITGTALILARSGGGIAGQAAAATLGAVLVSLALTWEATRRHPGLIRGALSSPPDREAARALGGLSVLVLVVHLSGRLSFMTDSYIVGIVLGPSEIASLYATARLGQLAVSQLQMVGNASWAGLAELHNRGERIAFNAKLIELSGLIALLGVTILAPIAAYNHAFVDLWMRGGDVSYGGDLLTLAGVFAALLQALFSLWGWCFTGTGNLGRVALAQFVSAVVNVIASVTLTRWLGLPGPMLGTLVAFVAVNAWFFPLQLHRAFGTSPRALAMALARPLAPGLAFGVALWFLARSHRPPGWIGLGAEMATAALAYLAFAWVFVLRPGERDVWRRRLPGLRPRFPGGRGPRPPEAREAVAEAAR